jgi:hypothetical protein
MITREQIETLLRINGVPPAAPEEQIRSVLLSARFNEDEVDGALMVLRENSQTRKTSLQTAHKIFRSNQTLSPQEISELLGIDVSVEEFKKDHKRIRQLSQTQFLLILLISLTAALAALTFMMYTARVGVFHPQAGELRSL